MVRCSLGMKLLLSGLCILIASCRQSDGASGNSDLDKSIGRLNLAVTDAPVDYAVQVVVQFSGIEITSGTKVISLHLCEDPADATATIVSAGTCAKNKPAAIDLLMLHSGGIELLLSRYPLDAGHYDSVRLLVDAMVGVEDSYIVLGPDKTNPKLELDLPSDAEAGLMISRGFDIVAGDTLNLTIDFDLRKSVREEGVGVYKLRPSLRMVDNSKTGFIDGPVYGTDPALTATTCFSSVYVYPGSNITPDDVGSSNGPLTSATINISPLENGDYAYYYRAAFLEAGDYTVAYTCQARNDDPAVDDNLTFLRTANVTVRVGVGARYIIQ